jgi:hypothetical protein
MTIFYVRKQGTSTQTTPCEIGHPARRRLPLSRRAGVLPGLLLAALVPALGAAPSATAHRPVRHVIIVENTKNMDRQRGQSADIASRLILDGFGRRARPGDGVELWLVEDQVRTDVFERFTWDRLGAVERSTQAFRLLRDLRPTVTTAALGNVVPAVGAPQAALGPTVIYLVTSGVDSLLGTPYDEPVNAIFFAHRERLRKARTPFVTVLAAQDGAWVGHGVTPGDRVPYIPPLPQPKPEKPPPSATPKTNTVQQPPPAPLITAQAPRPLSVEEISRQIREQAEKQARLAPPAAAAPPPPTAVAEAVGGPAPAGPATTIETRAEDPVAGAPFSAAGTPVGPPPSPPNAGPRDPGVGEPTAGVETAAALAEPALESAAAVPLEAPHTVPATEPGLGSTLASGGSEEPGRAASLWRDAVVGLLLLVVAVVAGLVLIRQTGRRCSPSLITESFDRLKDARTPHQQSVR